MVRKILVVLLILVMLSSVTGLLMAKADDGSPVPDIITDKIIFVSPAVNADVIAGLKEGTLGIVSWKFDVIGGTYIGFDIPGANVGTDVVVYVQKKIDVAITTPVALRLQEDKILVYFEKNINVVSLSWNDLSISEVQSSWFPKYISAQIVKIEDTGASESETDYCCYPVTVQKSYFYKIYLTTNIDPYNPPTDTDIDIIVGVMIPDYLVLEVENLAENGKCIWIGINGDNQIYIWLLH